MKHIDKDLQELRANVVHALGLCAYSCDGKNHIESTDEDERSNVANVMALFNKAYKAKLHNLVTQANEFGAKAGSLEVGYAHLRDLMQEELSHTELQPHKEDE